jgi:putative oxidoreductase
MTYSTMDDAGKFIIRLTLGILILLHGISKLAGGIDGISGMLQGIGLPGFIGWGVYLGEVLGPVLLILGFYARIGAVLILINMIFALLLAHRPDLLALTAQGGWKLELQGMFLLTALGLLFTGPGRWSINDR